MPEVLLKEIKETCEGPSLATFASMRKGESAPWWLFKGICEAWGFDSFRTAVTLITVSENITFLASIDDKPYGVIRVSQPGYVGGPDAINSELTWLTSLGSIEDVNLVSVIPTVETGNVAVVRDGDGIEWAIVCTSFVEGTVLEDLPDPSSYYRTIGHWSAEFHNKARLWNEPEGFVRFNWGLSDMIGPAPRWGRWEETDITPEQYLVLKRAEEKAIRVMTKAPHDSYSVGLIHADLRPSNIIAGEDGRLTVIDFDDCGYSWYLYDYAAALSFVEHEPYAPDMAKAWIAGYREVTSLSDEEIEIAGALSMIRRLQMLGWTGTHYEDALPAGLYKAQAPGTVYCAERYLESSTWLLD